MMTSSEAQYESPIGTMRETQNKKSSDVGAVGVIRILARIVSVTLLGVFPLAKEETRHFDHGISNPVVDPWKLMGLHPFGNPIGYLSAACRRVC